MCIDVQGLKCVSREGEKGRGSSMSEQNCRSFRSQREQQSEGTEFCFHSELIRRSPGKPSLSLNFLICKIRVTLVQTTFQDCCERRGCFPSYTCSLGGDRRKGLCLHRQEAFPTCQHVHPSSPPWAPWWAQAGFCCCCLF